MVHGGIGPLQVRTDAPVLLKSYSFSDHLPGRAGSIIFIVVMPVVPVVSPMPPLIAVIPIAVVALIGLIAFVNLNLRLLLVNHGRRGINYRGRSDFDIRAPVIDFDTESQAGLGC